MELNQSNYNIVAEKIVAEQEQIIGPLAYDLASKAVGIGVHDHHVDITGDPKTALENLVIQFKGLFGQASIEASKNALRNLSFSLELPAILLN